MKKVLLAALLYAAGSSLPAFAQTTNVTASNLKMGGAPIAVGTVTLTPVDRTSAPISFTDATGALNDPTGFTGAIANGAITGTFSVPDQALSTATVAGTPLYYSVSIYNTNTKKTFSFMIPPSTITGTSFALDHYAPAQAAYVFPGGLGVGASLPNGGKCNAPSHFATFSGTTITATYECVAGTFQQVPSGGNGTNDYNALINRPVLSAVATSGKYSDLSGTPSIPTVPSNVSGFTNDAGYQTSTQVSSAVASQKNAMNGIAGLDNGGMVALAQLPTVSKVTRNIIQNYAASPNGATTTTVGVPLATGATIVPVTNASTFVVGNGVWIAGAGAQYTPTINTTSGSAAITVSSATGLAENQVVVANGIPTGTRIGAVNGTTVYLNAAATATASGVASTITADYIGTVQAQSGNTLTVAPGITTAVASGASVQHDETVAFQSAIAAGGTSANVDLIVPPGVYNVYGVPQDGSGARAVLPMPKIDYQGQQPTTITIRGVQPPAGEGGYDANASTIHTNLVGGNLFGGYNSASTGFPPLTNVILRLSNLQISGYGNPGFVAINASNIAALEVSHVTGNVGLINPPNPTNTTGGFLYMPAIENMVQNSADEVMSTGFYNAYKFTEHAQISRAFAATCGNAFTFDNGTNSASPSGYVGNAVSADYLWALGCINGITAGSRQTFLDVKMADLEYITGNGINDPSNLLYGSVHYNVPYVISGQTQANPKISGAANLALFNTSNRHQTGLGSIAVGTAADPGNGSVAFSGTLIGGASVVASGSNIDVTKLSQSLVANSSLVPPKPGQWIVLVNATGNAITIGGVNNATINSAASYSLAAYSRHLLIANPDPAFSNDWINVN